MLLSLGQRFGLAPDDLPVRPPYLFAPLEALENWRARLEGVRGFANGDRKPLRIGIACSGNPGHARDSHRSIPLERFAPLLRKEHEVHLVQNTLRADDQAAFERYAIVDHRQWLQSMSDTAALVSCLDMVISVDTSVAHLCGALGVPVLLLLDAEPDWRWQAHRSDSPWYPSARLFRQSIPGDWDGPIEEAAVWIDGIKAAPVQIHRAEPIADYPLLPIRSSQILPPDLLSMLRNLGGRHKRAVDSGDLLALQYIISEYRALLEYDADWFDLQRLLGIALMQTGQLAAALTHADLALGIKPDSAESWHLRGLVLDLMGRPQDAQECRKKAANLGALRSPSR